LPRLDLDMERHRGAFLEVRLGRHETAGTAPLAIGTP
jgi:hypothetical protein